MRRRPSTPREVPAVIWVPKRKRRNRRGKRRSQIPEAPYPTRLPIPRRSESSHPRNATPSGSRFLQEPPRNPAIPRQKLQDIPRAMELPPVCQGPARSLDEAARRRCHFWDTQPVPKLNELITSHGAVEADKDGMRQESCSLPQGFTGDILDPGNANVLQELYPLLRKNYVEDEANAFRRDYWPEFLLCVKKMVEINFLCVRKKLRSKWAGPVWIREITRRVNPEGIFQAVYPAAVVLPPPVATCRSWRHSLNPRKLAKVQFPHVSRQLTLQRMTGPCRLPEKASGKLVDFLSFYRLLSTVTLPPALRSFKASSAFDNIHTETPLPALMGDALITAKLVGLVSR